MIWGRGTADAMTTQRRGKRLAMNRTELDLFLASERTCRVATLSGGGLHNTPLWFVWHDGALWVHSIVQSQRWADLERNPQVAVVVDAGQEFTELRGVELHGAVTVVGEVPRVGEPNAQLTAPSSCSLASTACPTSSPTTVGTPGCALFPPR